MSFFFTTEHKVLKRLSLAALVLSFGLIEHAAAQSGRKTQNPSPSRSPVPSTPTPPETSQPETFAKPGALKHRVQLRIARQPTSRRLQSEDGIFASFINRLKQYTNISATPMGDLKHDQAVKRAQGETEALVVLLSFEIDSFQGGTIILNSPDLQVEYLILEPRTGRKHTKGKVYFQAIGGGRMRRSEWPGGTPIKITPEAAGIEAADHVFDWLRLHELRKIQTGK